MKADGVVTVAQLGEFDEIIDVRSPSEFREDHITGAVNCPVLDDEERARVGTVYKASPFEARKLGAALISRNIARHLEQVFSSRPRHWRPLVYCWRGGKRSGALAHVLNEIGWQASRLEGGYKAYRRQVIGDLEALPSRLAWRVVCGPTGSGKSRLLKALEAAGAQVLDLEGLACHRGSVLGEVPGAGQPSQKLFESRIWAKLTRFDPQRPVFVEAESRKIGVLRVPQPLLDTLWSASQCLRLETPLQLRIALLMEEYRHFLDDPSCLRQRLACLRPLHGAETIARWMELAEKGAWEALVAELLAAHYDPAYFRSTLQHYPSYPEAPALSVEAGDQETMARLAQALCR